ncbi:MAG TPA: LysM peptidoglycan-binding domain-containing protein, partial [Candidatus Saccharimonadales bacterium]|nr:LysM peptidoglycan-binding domain-containing protein [Candidatus Saccharimonadales bacterium]
HASRTAGMFVASSLLVSAAQVHAQDVAEAARQSRARKENAQKKNTHVYTEQDLQRAEILTPEDRAEVAAKRNTLQPGQAPQESIDAKSEFEQLPLTRPADEQTLRAQELPEQDAAAPSRGADFSDVHVSLGEVARAYRKQKELAAQSKTFHLPFSEQPTLAAPKSLPVVASRPEKPAAPRLFKLRKPVEAPSERARAFKPTLRSPFGRPAIHMPASSEITANQAAPAAPETIREARPHNFGTPRVAPRVPSHAAAIATAPALSTPSVSAEAPALSVPLPLAKPRTTIRLTETPAPILQAPTLATLVAPELKSREAFLSAPLTAPVTVAKPARVLHLGSATTPAIPANVAVPPAAVVAPILNLAAPKSFAANPAVAARPAEPGVAHNAKTPARLTTITVQVGDSLWTLAQKNLGNGSRWHELMAVNPAVTNPDHIMAGATLSLPGNTAVTQQTPVAGTKIVVKKGDTLWAIAQSRFGHAETWNCIAHGNPTLKNPNRILVQQEIFLPASCGK